MSLRDSEAPFVPMGSAPKPPRPWREMLETWNALLSTLAATTVPAGVVVPLVVVTSPRQSIEERRLWLQVWRWMWSLPPCSEARKAVFMLGHAALLIDRWRKADAALDGGPMPAGVVVGAQEIGQRAEAALRIAALHVDDARGEANARKLGHEPTIPAYERIYSRSATGDGAVFAGPPTGEQRLLMIDPSRAANLARAILDDYAWRTSGARRRIAADHIKPFTELAIASLPNGPWRATSVDVQRFIDLIEEENET